MLQVDGSRHDWLQGRGPWLTLIGGIDDATGVVPYVCFREQKDSYGYMLLLQGFIQRKGIPLTLYSDRHRCIYRTDIRATGGVHQPSPDIFVVDVAVAVLVCQVARPHEGGGSRHVGRRPRLAAAQPVSSSGIVDKMLTPGAAISTSGPVADVQGVESLLLMETTAITSS